MDIVKFSESYRGQPVFVTNESWKIGYIIDLSIVEYVMDRHVGTPINTINEVYVLVDHGDHDKEYNLNDLTPAKGNI